jgi:ribosomal protein S30
MSKLFTVAGTSSLDGVVKFRVANGTAAARANVLAKNGHTCIELQDLPEAMTKEAAQAFLKYVEGTAATVTKAGKVAKKTKEFKVKNKAAAAPKVAQTAEELAAVKAKNLETMRKVTAKQSRFSAETEAMQARVRAEFAEIEAEMDKVTAADIPAIFRKECGFAE